MAIKNDARRNTGQIRKISLINYDPARQAEYSQNFVAPLIEGLLKRMVQKSKDVST